MNKPRSKPIRRQVVQTKSGQKFDAPWKKVIELYFKDFISFFFPQIFDKIDWNRSFQFLDKELHQAIRGTSSGTQVVDKLVKVWTADGQETCVLMHIEVQNQRQSDFARRMYVYNHRIFDQYNKKVVSLAILGDKNINWKPDFFSSRLWDCELFFKFPIIK